MYEEDCNITESMQAKQTKQAVQSTQAGRSTQSTQAKQAMRRKGFTLIELLIVIAIIVVLVAISIPVFRSLLEKSREAVDLANVRSAYAEVMVAAALQDTSDPLYDSLGNRYYKTVDLEQKKDGWDTDTDKLVIGGIPHSDSTHWRGDAKAKGKCTVSFDNSTDEVTLIWSGYTVKNGYYIDFSSGTVSIKPGSGGWPSSAISEPIDAKVGQTIVVKKITEDEFPNLYKYVQSGGGYEIGISVIDSNGKEISDTGGQWIYTDEDRNFVISPSGVSQGKDVQLAVQFFKMKSNANRGLGSIEMTDAEAKELENILSVE